MTDIQEVLKRVDAFAAHIGSTAPQIIEVLIKQARIEAVADVCWFILVGAGSVISAEYAIKLIKEIRQFKKDNPYVNIDGRVLCIGILSLVFFFSTLAAGACLQSSLTEFINPQYWALQQLLKVL